MFRILIFQEYAKRLIVIIIANIFIFVPPTNIIIEQKIKITFCKVLIAWKIKDWLKQTRQKKSVTAQRVSKIISLMGPIIITPGWKIIIHGKKKETLKGWSWEGVKKKFKKKKAFTKKIY